MKRIEESASIKRVSLEQMMIDANEKEKTEVSIIVKADVHGSKEAIEQSLKKMNSETVSIKIQHTGVGEINESDVSLAIATKAIIFGFNVRANMQAKNLSKRDNIVIKYFSIIYQVIDEAKKIIEGLFEAKIIQKQVGEVEVRKLFKISNNIIAGCYVENGKVPSKAIVKVIRNNDLLFETNIKKSPKRKMKLKK